MPRPYDCHTNFPSIIVAITCVSAISIGSMVKMSRSRTTRSANLPGVNDPLRFSSYEAYAAPALPDRPAIGPIQALSGPPSGGGELAGPAPKASVSDAGAQALARHVFVEGGDQPPRPNRADDYSWKPPAP